MKTRLAPCLALQLEASQKRAGNPQMYWRGIGRPKNASSTMSLACRVHCTSVSLLKSALFSTFICRNYLFTLWPGPTSHKSALSIGGVRSKAVSSTTQAQQRALEGGAKEIKQRFGHFCTFFGAAKGILAVFSGFDRRLLINPELCITCTKV